MLLRWLVRLLLCPIRKEVKDGERGRRRER